MKEAFQEIELTTEIGKPLLSNTLGGAIGRANTGKGFTTLGKIFARLKPPIIPFGRPLAGIERFGAVNYHKQYVNIRIGYADPTSGSGISYKTLAVHRNKLAEYRGNYAQLGADALHDLYRFDFTAADIISMEIANSGEFLV